MTNLADTVQIIHLKKRQGLIRARLAGARKATSEILIFLDSHTEANVNWLPPLLGMVFLLHIILYSIYIQFSWVALNIMQPSKM